MSWLKILSASSYTFFEQAGFLIPTGFDLLLTHSAPLTKLDKSSMNTALPDQEWPPRLLSPVDTFQSTLPRPPLNFSCCSPPGDSTTMVQRLAHRGGSALWMPSGITGGGGRGRWESRGAPQGLESRTHIAPCTVLPTLMLEMTQHPAYLLQVEEASLALQYLLFLLKIHPFE